eukprot:scaffold133785_cov21-Tisochrysis_lutea.AAC.1
MSCLCAGGQPNPLDPSLWPLLEILTQSLQTIFSHKAHNVFLSLCRWATEALGPLPSANPEHMLSRKNAHLENLEKKCAALAKRAQKRLDTSAAIRQGWVRSVHVWRMSMGFRVLQKAEVHKSWQLRSGIQSCKCCLEDDGGGRSAVVDLDGWQDADSDDLMLRSGVQLQLLYEGPSPGKRQSVQTFVLSSSAYFVHFFSLCAMSRQKAPQEQQYGPCSHWVDCCWVCVRTFQLAFLLCPTQPGGFPRVAAWTTHEQRKQAVYNIVRGEGMQERKGGLGSGIEGSTGDELVGREDLGDKLWTGKEQDRDV